MFFRVVSIWRLKPLLGKGSSANSLPIGLNRISWKHCSMVGVTMPSFRPTDWVKSD